MKQYKRVRAPVYSKLKSSASDMGALLDYRVGWGINPTAGIISWLVACPRRTFVAVVGNAYGKTFFQKIIGKKLLSW